MAHGCCTAVPSISEESSVAGRSRKRSASPSAGNALPASDDAGQGEAKRQRLRPVLTCIPCKRRKIKCDRNLPCDSCVKRGEADSCQWDTHLQPERSQYARADDLQSLQQRLEFLESALKSNPNSSAICCPASCSCHDASKTRSRGEPVATAEDLPLSQLIDLKLGFRRDLELVNAAVVDPESKSVLIEANQSGLSTIWVDATLQRNDWAAGGDHLATL